MHVRCSKCGDSVDSNFQICEPCNYVICGSCYPTGCFKNHPLHFTNLLAPGQEEDFEKREAHLKPIK
jgi:hypothetical protein